MCALHLPSSALQDPKFNMLDIEKAQALFLLLLVNYVSDSSMLDFLRGTLHQGIEVRGQQAKLVTSVARPVLTFQTDDNTIQ